MTDDTLHGIYEETPEATAEATTDGAGGNANPPEATAGDLDLGSYLPQHVDRESEMNAVNSSNAEARQKAIADGMDEGTAQIVYPEFSTPEDMDRIN